MKKKILVILSACICLMLVSCSKIPSGMSEDAYDYCVKAVDTVEDFLSGDLTAREARDKLDVLSSTISSFDSDEFGENDLLPINVRTLQITFTTAVLREDAQGSVPSKDIEDIRNQLDSIKEDLNL